MAEIVTHLHVDAPAAAVWEVLADFERYPDWNPMMVRMIGRPERGAWLRLHVDVRGSIRRLPARVLVADPGEELRWGGGVPGLLWIEHYVCLSPDGDRTRVVHGERFTGLLGPILGRAMRPEIYEAMNQALAQRLADRVSAAAAPAPDGAAR